MQKDQFQTGRQKVPAANQQQVCIFLGKKGIATRLIDDSIVTVAVHIRRHTGTGTLRGLGGLC